MRKLLLFILFVFTLNLVMSQEEIDLEIGILEKLDQRGGGIQLAHFEEVFTKEYVREHRLVDVRLTEQLSTTVAVSSSRVDRRPNVGPSFYRDSQCSQPRPWPH